MRRRAAGIAIGLTLAACSGALDAIEAPSRDLSSTPGQTGSPGTSPPAGGPVDGMTRAPLDCAAAPLDPGPSPLQLLTREQYVNTLRDLFGGDGDVTGMLDGVPLPSAFGLQQPDVSQVELEGFQKAAAQVAQKVVAHALATVAPCKTQDRACARDFVARFAAIAYRAPLDEADVQRHLALYDAGARVDHAHGIELTLRGMLQSPRFLYRVELGTKQQEGAKAVLLSDYELAARLSYVFLKSLPDAALREAASQGQLHTRAQLLAQVDRLLRTDPGKLALREFLEALVHLPTLSGLVKDEVMFPDWQPDALAEQARAFFDRVLAEQDGTVSALLTSHAARSDGQGAGLMTLPAVLALHAKADESSPIYRGKFVREVLLCMQLPGPPADIPKAPEVDASSSTRERLRQHEVDPACSGCHRLLDPIGFGLEHFDAVGNYRQDDGGKSVDARGELFSTQDANGKFDGAAELGARLAASAQVQECVARQWFRFALGRFEQPVDACTVRALSETFAAAQGSLHALPRAIVESDAFLYRRPVEPNLETP
jgi:hypothetical protein